MNNLKIEELISTYKEDDSIESNQDEINLIFKILSLRKFCHDGWLDYAFYRTEAAEMISTLLKKYKTSSAEHRNGSGNQIC